MKRKHLIIFTLITIIIIGVIFFSQIPDIKPIYSIKELTIGNNKPVFFKAKEWGMTYDKEVIILSTKEETEFIEDSTKDYIYPGAAFLFYKVSNDSLFIYTDYKASVPEKFDSKIVIKQIELDNPAIMNLKANDAYKQQNLSEFGLVGPVSE